MLVELNISTHTHTHKETDEHLIMNQITILVEHLLYIFLKINFNRMLNSAITNIIMNRYQST